MKSADEIKLAREFFEIFFDSKNLSIEEMEKQMEEEINFSEDKIIIKLKKLRNHILNKYDFSEHYIFDEDIVCYLDKEDGDIIKKKEIFVEIVRDSNLDGIYRVPWT